MTTQARSSSVVIFVDADACPVKTETIGVAARHGVEVYVVSNGGIRPSPYPKAKTIVVDAGADMADRWIIENIRKSDILTTSDIPLSSLAINIGATVILPDGEILGPNNIGIKNASRNLMSELRSTNPFHREKGKQFTKLERIRYINALEKTIQTIKKSL